MNSKNRPVLFNPWVWKMAWRDSRTHRKRLLLYMSSIIFGIASLVSIASFGENLEVAIAEQAKTLLGADLLVSSLQPFSPEAEALFDSVGGEQSREIVFNSMAYFPKNQGTRLVRVKALAGDFPFYGDLTTEPVTAANTYKSGANALVDQALMLQFDLQAGDSIKIGAKTFQIAGRLTKIPSEPPISSTFSPQVYLPLRFVTQTNLIQRGSLILYHVYFKFADEVAAEQRVQKLTPYLNKYRLSVDTVEKRKNRFGRVMKNLYRFLNLVGFIALILGSVGVASAVHVYIKQKLDNVSILRCVGAQAKQTLCIYLIQTSAIGLVGSMVGALLGLGVQTYLPEVFSDFLPVTIEHFVAWGAVLQGLLIGLGMALLFSLLPLVSIRKVSPLLALRSSFDDSQKAPKDSLRWLILCVIVVAIGAFGIYQSGHWILGLSFCIFVGVAFAVLAGVAKLITVLFKKGFPRTWPYVWRQGLANLYRPNNQTLSLMLAVGLGTFLITTLYLTQETLLKKISFAAGEGRPNLVLFDVQPDQKEALVEQLRSSELPILQAAPMVTMRLQSLKGRRVEAILNDSTRSISKGLLTWEYRTTYRDSLFDSEQIVAGEWQGQVADGSEVVPISFEQGAAARLGVTVGDTIVWDVQGLPLTTTVGSLRKVDWQRFQANFMVVFPQGVLESAPQIYILATRADSPERSARLQRAVVQTFPNVSMIDLTLVLDTIETFLDKIAFVIRFMAFFSIFTGLIVLAAAVITSRYQRLQESVLLRTLGAAKTQVKKIMAIEYLFLGCFAALTGLLLSYLSSWALAYFAFDSVFVPTILPFVIVLATVTGLTIMIGMINSRGIFDRPPLEVLRIEV